MSEYQARIHTDQLSVPACLGFCNPDNNTNVVANNKAEEYFHGLKEFPSDLPPKVYVEVSGVCEGFKDCFLAGIECGMEFSVKVIPVDSFDD